MQLFQSWKDSLKFFTPSNFKLFGLVTLNTTIQTYRTWFTLFWPLFLISIAADVFHFFPFTVGPIRTSIGVLIAIFCKVLLLMTLFISVRPSTKRKTYSYFWDYRLHSLFIGLAVFIKTFLFQIITGAGPFSADLFVLSAFSPLYLAIVTIFMLFYLDSRGTFIDMLLSFWRYVKMLWYGLPFCLVVTIGATVIFYVIFSLLGLGLFPFVKIVRSVPSGKPMLFFWSLTKHAFMILSVPVISMVANFYTKRLHDQFKLYFH